MALISAGEDARRSTDKNRMRTLRASFSFDLQNLARWAEYRSGYLITNYERLSTRVLSL